MVKHYLLQRKSDWLNKFLQHLRFSQIKPYIKKEDIICDLGCGDRSFLKILAPEIREGYGIDIDKETPEFKEKNSHFISGDITKPLPFEDEKFNAVLCSAVLEHLESPDSIFIEVWRILKRKGLFILTTPAPPSQPLLEFLAFILKITPEKKVREDIKEHKHYYSKQELINLLEQHNFKILELKPFCLGLNILAVARKKT